MGFGMKKDRTIKVLRMELPIAENVPTLCGSIFKLSRGSQLPYNNKSKIYDFYCILNNFCCHSHFR